MRRRRQQADRGSRSFTSVAGPPRTLPRIGVLCNLQMRPTLLLALLATLAALVAACKGSDGSYWALQSWQPNLPHRGFPPYRARQTDWELDVSHWTGPIAELELHADWAFGGQAHNLFGRLTYGGVPVYG